MELDDGWLLTPERVALHRPTATAVIADVHLGYDQARRRRGDAVPLVTVAEQLAPLGRVALLHDVRRLVVAGDFFEEDPGAELVAELVGWLGEAGVKLAAVVPGNHDEGLDSLYPELPWRPDGVWCGRWLVLHGDGRLPREPVLHGHVHPMFRIGQINKHCFLVSDRRLILPAFSDDAAGVNVLTEPHYLKHRCYVCGDGKVLDFGEVQQMAATGK